MVERRRFLLGSLAAVAAARARAAPPRHASVDLDRLGQFEVVRGRPGVVVGVPHGSADSGTLELGRIVRERLGAGGVFVTGFWDPKTRERVNVNRPTEQLIGPESQVQKQWRSDRAVAANARYEARVKEAAQGPVQVYFEIHSNHRPLYARSIEVSTQGVGRHHARLLKVAFESGRSRLAADVPRLEIHVSPLDKVAYPNYAAASTISKFSERGCALEAPGTVMDNRAWRVAYAGCLADAILAARWAE